MLMPRQSAIALGLMAVIQVVAHAPYLGQPPVGAHTWRQMVGLSAARNYYREDNRLLYPRADMRTSREDTGAIIHEFPLLYWVIAQTYFLTGEHDANSRIIMLVFCLLMIPAAYALARFFAQKTAPPECVEPYALWFAFFMVMTPYFFYYAMLPVPNLPALMLFLAGSTALMWAVEERHLGVVYVFGVACILFAVLLKSTYLFIGLALAAWCVWRLLTVPRRVSVLQIGGAGLIVALGYGSFMWHAKELNAGAPMERAMHAQLRLAERPETWGALWRNIEVAAGTWFVELIVGHAALLAVITGIVLVFRRQAWRSLDRGAAVFAVGWAVAFGVFASIFVVRFGDHAYYITALCVLPPAFGALAMTAELPRWWRRVLLVGAVLMPVMMVVRVHKRFTTDLQVPQALLDERPLFGDVIPEDDLVVIVGERTPNVYLYYLERKGIADNNLAGLDMPRLYAGGFRWLVHRREIPVDVSPFVSEKVRSAGALDLYRLRPP